jgi:protein-L-isoaspartate(D-aspartate) O-methyltransferase
MTGVVLRCAAAFLFGTAAGTDGGCTADRSSVSDEAPPQVAAEDSGDFARLRERMVEQQIRARDITDARVLAAMLKVPRHEFVPRRALGSAYEDGALPLALGQTVSQPYIVAFMTQALACKGSERVLEIGTGSGYQAAVLAELASEVYTIEILPELAERARTVLQTLGYRNIHFRTGDGYQGWPEAAPFDAIVVTAAPDHIPPPLVDQLKPGGRMILPVGHFEQELVIIEKDESGTRRRSTIPVRFVPMTGRAQQGPPK